KETLPETGEERRRYLLKMLLESSQVNFYELSEQMCISEFSLENDVNKIRRLLETEIPQAVEHMFLFIHNMLTTCANC
ncbi:MAG: helix-turn-helix domain-containing protein, partial [Eubacteriales bacterium]|nr:helix-turn-helix domain-containing protein [Eubacteriales bacterium]